MGFGTKGCEYNCGDECDGRCLPFKNEIKIPTHDPSTGELNPYYEELTGEPNPLRFTTNEVELNVSKFKNICSEIANRLSNLPYNGDISDIGNEIGIIIAKYFDDKNFGWDEEGFIDGLNHGISLTDGTHG